MPPDRALGPFAVRAATAEAAAFAHETGGNDGAVPFTFPVRWLARPEFQAVATELIGNDRWVPIHESQSFDYRASLAVDTDYVMTVTMKREVEPSRIILVAQIGPAGEVPRLDMEMILRIVPLPAEQAA